MYSSWVTRLTTIIGFFYIYNGLFNATKTLVNVTVGGSLIGRKIEDAYEMLEVEAVNAY